MRVVAHFAQILFVSRMLLAAQLLVVFPETKKTSRSDLCMVTDLTWTTPYDHLDNSIRSQNKKEYNKITNVTQSRTAELVLFMQSVYYKTKA